MTKRTIPITETIYLDEDEITQEFLRDTGPGGQNVNKVSTAVRLRLDVSHSPSLPEDIARRLKSIAGRLLNAEGILIVVGRRFRTQEQNRRDAMERMVHLLRKAAVKPKPRRPTRPTLASRQRRMEEKRRRSQVKSMRKQVSE